MKLSILLLSIFFSANALFSQTLTPKVLKGTGSFYADQFNGRRTSSGEIFDMMKFTAAHREFPFNTILKVTNTSTGEFVLVRVNDRGPFIMDRIIDLSYAAADKLGYVPIGLQEVELEFLGIGKPEENPPQAIEDLEAYKKTLSPGLPDDYHQLYPTDPAKLIMDARAKKTYRDLQGNTVRTPKGFGLQIAVYANEDYAKTLGADVASKGFSNVYIESFYNSKNGVTYYRVIYGEFETMQMTAPESKKLLQAGFDAHFIYTYPRD